MCLQETHGRLEQLLNIDIVPGSGDLEKIGTFAPGNVNSGGSVVVIWKDILDSGTSIEHEEIFREEITS